MNKAEKLFAEWEKLGAPDKQRLKLVKRMFPRLSLDAQKAMAQAMRLYKRAKRLPPETSF